MQKIKALALTVLVGLGILAMPTPALAIDGNYVWGHGNISCREFVSRHDDYKAGVQNHFERFESWMQGFLTAENAEWVITLVGRDKTAFKKLNKEDELLYQADMDSYIQWMRSYCLSHGNDNVYDASLGLVQFLMNQAVARSKLRLSKQQ